MLLTDLAAVARTSGLRVIELEGWRSNISAGAFNPKGVLCHHTGSFDEIGDTSSDLAYARWLAFTGRDDLPPPLCNLALSAESVVYVCSAGNANHAGEARASGPMPAASDGNSLYVGIEAMNSGSQGWGSVGTDAQGVKVTQREGYARLCAALCRGYGWSASHVRAHRETSVTGKPDPGLLAMDPFRADVARLITGDWFDMATRADLAAELKPLQNQLDTLLARTEGLRITLGQISTGLAAVDAELDTVATRAQAQRIRADIRELQAIITAVP
jgi:hypothetical protein